MDTAVIEDGKVVQVWRDTTIKSLTDAGITGSFVEFPAETAVVCGMLWDGTSLSYPPIKTYVPEVVTPYQARMALLNAGLLDQVEALVENESTPREVKLAWEWAVAWYRSSAFIETLGATLGLSASQIDALFVEASQVQ